MLPRTHMFNDSKMLNESFDDEWKSNEFCVRVQKLYEKTFGDGTSMSRDYCYINLPKQVKYSVIFYGYQKEVDCLKEIKEKLTFFKNEMKWLKANFKIYKNDLIRLEKITPNYRYSHYHYYKILKEQYDEIIGNFNEANNLIKGFKKVKKHKDFGIYVYDDTTVVCYDVNGDVIYVGDWDYSPAKEYETEHDGYTYPQKYILSKYHKNKNKNVEIIFDITPEIKIYGYYGFVDYKK